MLCFNSDLLCCNMDCGIKCVWTACGREFALILYIQDWLSPFHSESTIMCRHSPNKYDDEERDVIEGIIECS